MQITDYTNNPSGYEGGGNTINYDTNGNMTTMLDKGITNIGYNFLNLPNAITTISNQRTTLYTYRADGVKLRKIYNHIKQDTGEGFTTSTEYIDGFQYLTTQGTPIIENNPAELAYEQEAFLNELNLSPNEIRLQFFPTAEGFFDFENNSYIYNYKPSEAVRRFL